MKEIILKEIKECKEVFDKHKEQEGYTENNAWYYLGVFDILYGLYYGEESAEIVHDDTQSLTDNINRIVTEFLLKNDNN